MAKTNNNTRKADQYNDPKHNYLQYWEGRQYENAAEELAIKKLLKGKHFYHAVDIGGGYGRLCILYEDYADLVTLAEPSDQQLDIAKDYLKDHPEIERKKLQAANLGYADGSVDLISMIRVMHHLPDPMPEFKELSRVLSDDGYLILEIANYTHFENRIKHITKMKKFPVEPVDIRSRKNKRSEEIAFVNHNPRTVIKQLSHVNLKVEKILSVSNLRSPGLKKIVPIGVMLKVENMMQAPLAKSFFGPSVFLLVKKAH
jgi:ubiquinone/menaquinone biosynthesis C-methylase UbiE